MIRALAKRLPHPLLMRLHQRHQLAQQLALARQISLHTGLPLLKTLELSPLKTSDTVFILGGGASINQISQEKWKIIGEHDSIAMNFWLAHPFVPKIFLFENIRPGEDLELMFRVFHDLLDRRAFDYRNTVKIISELAPLSCRQLVLDVPKAFRPHLYIGHSANIVARDEKELVAGIRYMIRQGAFEPRDHIAWHLKCGGSVLAALSMAVCMAYSRIILCGIDLGNAEYFYQDVEKYPEASQWEFSPRNQPHPMARRFAWGLPLRVVIPEFKRYVLDPAGIELFVENRSSALFPGIPELPADTLRLLAQMPAAKIHAEGLR